MKNKLSNTPNALKSGPRFVQQAFAQLFCGGLLIFTGTAVAQDVNDIRWKTESQVREILGEPQSTTPPTGTHATYTLWKYEDFTVAFANQRAFHLFKHNSLRKMELNEEREQNGS